MNYPPSQEQGPRGFGGVGQGPQSPPSNGWRESALVIVLACLCCFPAGLLFLWTSSRATKGTKIGGTVAVAVLVLIGLGGNQLAERSSTRSASPTVPSASPPVANEPTLESLCHLPAGTQSRFTEQRRERQDLPGVPRLSVWGTVPHGLSQTEVVADVCLATALAYTGSATKLGAVTVFAYRDTITTGGYTAARGVFAPSGQWEKANPNQPLANWKLSAEIAPGYLDADVPVANGTAITLADKDDKTVSLSNAAERWGDAEHVADVPNGTKARVLSHREFPRGDGTLIRYEVEITSGRRRRGWVHDYAVHASATSK